MGDQNNMTREPMMTAQEVADYLRLAKGTIRNKVSRGEIPYYKLENGAVRFRRAEIDRWVEHGNGSRGDE